MAQLSDQRAGAAAEQASSSSEGEQPATPSRLQLTGMFAVVLAYALLSYYSNEASNARGLGAALSVAPILVIAGVLLWRWTAPLIGALIAIGAGTLLYICWPSIRGHYEWADLGQQCGAYGLVAASFARSLYGGRVPLCTQIAQRLHGVLEPAELAYLRGATLAWAVFYALLGAAIFVLYFAATLHVWSLFVNFATFALIALMAVVDHAIRRRFLPRRATGGILSALRQSLIG
jgi:uncharacterized membrane protein